MPVPTSEHLVTSYDDELVQLAQTISEMGGMVEAALSNATNALLRLDHPMANQTIAADVHVDEMQRRIDDMAVSMIARRQPVAADLRMIIASIHVASDLERIGDMAKIIARRTLQIEDTKVAPQFYHGIRHMTDSVLRQIKAALDAFAAHDAQAAIRVCKADDDVDQLYVSLFRELLTYMMEDPRNITQCTNLLFCGKSLERTGDHATNIAEQAYYLETGKPLAADVDNLRTQPKP
jgi:phosphate transport system protein